jgi:DcuC family C4-dicarboxylate transporter
MEIRLILVLVVICITIFCLVRYEARLVLFCSGVVLSLIAMDPMAPFKGYSHGVAESRLIESIITVMGFAWVMKLTTCDKHLINMLIRPLRKAGQLVIPGGMMVTMFINISVTSSAGCSAAVGSILIPLMLAAGVHPPIAGAAIYACTYFAMLNPGYPQNVLISSVTNNTDTVTIVANHLPAMLASGALGIGCLWLLAVLRGEHKGYVPVNMPVDDDNFKTKLHFAVVPLIPIFILITGSMKLIPIFTPLSISHAMLIGSIVAFIVTRTNPQEIAKDFWKGAGYAYGHVVGIIICAMVFVSGLQAVGLIGAMMKLMTTHQDIAKISSAWGPFLLGLFSGSGDAASVAFNKAVTVHAAEFGLKPISMGSVAAICGALGRSMSPVAGGMIICAALAGTSPMETAKRNAPGMILACLATTFLLYSF